jgi:cellulose biosynthesis protein BcsQ
MAPRTVDTSTLFRGRCVFVTGKGGTGKTTVACAIARLAAAQGRRVLLAEVDNQRPSTTSIFGTAPEYAPKEVEKNLSICNIDWVAAMDDWVADIVAMPRLVRLITHNRVVTVFLEATPGARDLVVLMRILHHSQKFDLVVVDMPASGNAVGMLSVAVTAHRLFEAGPIRKCAEELLALYRRPDTAVTVVALPEEMVINETVETAQKIAREIGGLRIPLVILNRSTPPTLKPEEVKVLDALQDRPVEGLAAEVVEAGRWERSMEAATAEALRRFATEVEAPVLPIPVLARGEGAGRVVHQVTAALARASRSRVDLVGEVS